MQTVEKHMDVITSTEFERILAHRDKPCISLYMPTYRKAPEDQQNPIRFGNLMNEIKIQLEAQDYDKQEVERLLDVLEQPHLVDGNRPFWQHMSDGLAMFVAPDFFLSYRVPYAFNEFVYVSDRFHIRQLLPIILENEVFYVLTLNTEDVHLYRANRHQMTEMKLPDNTPQSLSEALKYDEVENQMQYHSTANQGQGDQKALFHGQGSASSEEYQQENLERFFKMLDNAICSLLNAEGKPLVIVGVDALRGMYRDVNHYNWLLAEDVDRDPQSLDLQRIHKRAWTIVESDIEQISSKDLAQFKQLKGNRDDRAVTDMRSIISAAHYQRIDTLFIPDEMYQWGNFELDKNNVVLHEEFHIGDLDLLNDAAIHTLTHGGIVHTLERKHMPDDEPAVAILRY